MDIVKSLAVILSLLAAVSAAILTMAGGGDGVWEHQGIVQVAAPKGRVFKWLTDPAKRQEWVVGLIASEVEPAGWLTKDSRLKETLMLEGVRYQQVLEFTDFEEGVRFAYRSAEGDIAIEMRYEVSLYLSGQRTRIDYSCKASYPGWSARVFEPILGHSRLARIEESFERLATKAEGDY